MRGYVYGSTRYQEYLAQEIDESLTANISKQTRTLIASQEQLHKESLEVSQTVSSNVLGELEQVRWALSDMQEGLLELNATFDWGVSNLLAGVGMMNDSLQQLIKIAKTPAQTWAYEQFEIAREAYRKYLDEESLDYATRAKDGFSSNTGYVLDFRFHYLLGTIRLGGFSRKKEIVNLSDAEQHFLSAAKYARMDFPREAARAMTAAGWSAYCQGEMKRAIQHTEQAVTLNPGLGEAYFQLAKIYMHLDNPHSGLHPISRTHLVS